MLYSSLSFETSSTRQREENSRDKASSLIFMPFIFFSSFTKLLYILFAFANIRNNYYYYEENDTPALNIIICHINLSW